MDLLFPSQAVPRAGTMRCVCAVRLSQALEPQGELWPHPCGKEGCICILWCGGGVLAKARDGYTAMGWPPGFGLAGPQRMKSFTRDPSWPLQHWAIRWGGWQGFEVLSLAGYKHVPMPASLAVQPRPVQGTALWQRDCGIPRCHQLWHSAATCR